MFRKQSRRAPEGYFRWEAAGLRWLAAADGAAVVEVVDVSDDHLDLKRLTETAPESRTAEAFGRALAITHDAGADAFGCPPQGWHGDGYFGPLEQPIPLDLDPTDSWGEFYADQRLRPIAQRCVDSGALSAGDGALLEQLADRVAAGEFDTDDVPARVHGDLWSGNLMWTEQGAVLIDPAAHGGHREYDLAMLALFGTPHLDRIVAAYDEAHPLADGWRDRVALHQLYPLAVHALLFGSGYAAQTMAAVRRYR
ncbi:fructosamine kinase family protein [Yimella sp. cx-573]|nr:fructosamine kinase family protein [Yimella sp. cx-573]